MASQPIGDRTGPEPLPGATLSREIAASEHVEKELDSFISRRHEQRVKAEGERVVEASWRESERREEARRAEEERVEQVKAGIARAAAEIAYSTRFETDHGLRWDRDREVWTTRDGFAYDGQRSTA